MGEQLTNRLFAKRAVSLAATINHWAAESLGENPNEPVSDDDLARFISEVNKATDRMWLEPVEWEPAAAEPGGPGSSFVNPRVSVLHPGQYIGRCISCDAHMLTTKRQLHCDDCETSRRAAVKARRAALNDRGQEGSGDAP